MKKSSAPRALEYQEEPEETLATYNHRPLWVTNPRKVEEIYSRAKSGAADQLKWVALARHQHENLIMIFHATKMMEGVLSDLTGTDLPSQGITEEEVEAMSPSLKSSSQLTQSILSSLRVIGMTSSSLANCVTHLSRSMDGFDRVDTEDYDRPSESDAQHLVRSANDVADMIIGMKLTLTHEGSEDFTNLVSDNPLFDPRQELVLKDKPVVPPRPLVGQNVKKISFSSAGSEDTKMLDSSEKRASHDSSTLSDISTLITEEGGEDSDNIAGSEKTSPSCMTNIGILDAVEVENDRYARLLEVMEMTRPDSQ